MHIFSWFVCGFILFLFSTEKTQGTGTVSEYLITTFAMYLSVKYLV